MNDDGAAAGRPVALAWAAWLLSSLFFFYALVWRVAPSVMVDALMRDFAVGGAILGNLSAFYFYAYAGLQIPIGVMLDRLGPRRLMSGGAALAGLGGILFALADSLTLAYLGRLLIGAGAASSWVGALTVIVQWFPARRFAALAGGTQAFGMMGAIAGQAPVGFAVAAWGWRPGMLWIGVAGLALALMLFLSIRDRPAAHHGTAGVLAALRIAVAQRQVWLSGAFGMAMVMPTAAFGGLWAVPYLMQVHGLGRAEAAGLTSLIFVSWALGAPLVGGLSDRLGTRRKLMVTGALVSALCVGALPFAGAWPAWTLGALMAAQGVAASSMVVGVALAREHAPAQVSSTALGLVNTFVIGSGAIFQPLIGFVLDLSWDGRMAEGARVYSPSAYAWALSVLPLACLAGLVAALLSREARPGDQAVGQRR
jgi:MFS family permease